MPMAGAPRTTMDAMAWATAAALSQATKPASSGR